MIFATEEKKSNGALIVFIDLLFLLIAFFTLLLFFLQERHRISEKDMDAVEKSLSRITGQEMAIPEALVKLETFVKEYVSEQELAKQREQRLANRRKRRAQRATARLEYELEPDGRIRYKDRLYTLARFRNEVVAPLRRRKWVSFRAFAAPQTPFGLVIESRRYMLRDGNEFDRYWDNVTSTEKQPGKLPGKQAEPPGGNGAPAR